MGRRLVATAVSHMAHAHEKHSDERPCHGRFTQWPEAQLALYPAFFALDSFRRKTWSDDPGSKMAFLSQRPQPSVVADITHNIANKTTETPSIPNG